MYHTNPQSFGTFLNLIQTDIFAARSDYSFISHTLPPLIEMCKRAKSNISLILDTKKPTGVLSHTVNQSEFQLLQNLLKDLMDKHNFNLILTEYKKQHIRTQNKIYLGCSYPETHCFRGYPILGSFKQFLNTDSKYLLHLDCDMIFYEAPEYSWIDEGINIMEENADILCVLPRGGPPTKDGTLKQGTTRYQVDEKRGLYLFKNFTSRHYLIHRERFISLLPLKPLWLSWREPIKSKLFGSGKMLCWEAIVEEALEKSNMWRADLMTGKAWSLHPGERSNLFHSLLPSILKEVQCGRYPPAQAGHFDLIMKEWGLFLTNK